MAHHGTRIAQAPALRARHITEERGDVSLPRFEPHLTDAKMALRRHWAGTTPASRSNPWPTRTPAGAAASGLGLSWCSSTLPCRSCVSSLVTG